MNWAKVARFPAMYQRKRTPEPPLGYFLDSFYAKFGEYPFHALERIGWAAPAWVALVSLHDDGVLPAHPTRRYVLTLPTSIGSVVGFLEPPSGSTVTATASAPSTGFSTTAAIESPLGSKRPLGWGVSPFMTQIW
jgi:hypothetical protein